jgi:hypothetical protein
MNDKPFPKTRCPACGKRFGSPRARAMHERDVHSSEALARRGAEKAALARRDDEEPSMADLVIEASINRAAGLRIEDWIEAMFGDYL